MAEPAGGKAGPLLGRGDPSFPTAPVEYGRVSFADRGRPDDLDACKTGNEGLEAGLDEARTNAGRHPLAARVRTSLRSATGGSSLLRRTECDLLPENPERLRTPPTAATCLGESVVRSRRGGVAR